MATINIIITEFLETTSFHSFNGSKKSKFHFCFSFPAFRKNYLNIYFNFFYWLLSYIFLCIFKWLHEGFQYMS